MYSKLYYFKNHMLSSLSIFFWVHLLPFWSYSKIIFYPLAPVTFPPDGWWWVTLIFWVQRAGWSQSKPQSLPPVPRSPSWGLSHPHSHSPSSPPQDDDSSFPASSSSFHLSSLSAASRVAPICMSLVSLEDSYWQWNRDKNQGTWYTLWVPWPDSQGIRNAGPGMCIWKNLWRLWEDGHSSWAVYVLGNSFHAFALSLPCHLPPHLVSIADSGFWQGELTYSRPAGVVLTWVQEKGTDVTMGFLPCWPFTASHIWQIESLGQGSGATSHTLFAVGWNPNVSRSGVCLGPHPSAGTWHSNLVLVLRLDLLPTFPASGQDSFRSGQTSSWCPWKEFQAGPSAPGILK